ncbi:MAG: sigma-E factor negative regulatory protein [Methylobacter sp.]|nr:sigma-E factor negative regulatory protein [Methylobacter sp.]
MYEDLNQNISQFLDKELDHNEALSLLNEIQAQPEARSKLSRYEAISHAMKTEVFLTVRPDFSERIKQEIQHEPTYLLPARKLKEHKQFKRNHKILAVAASLAVVAVITVQGVNESPDKVKIASITGEIAQQPLVEQPSEFVSYKNETEHSPINAQINDYLQAHNSSVYTNGKANFQPYARVTAYSRK